MNDSLARRLAQVAAGLATLAAGFVACTSPALAANTGTVSFTQTSFTVNENAGSVELDLQRTGDTSGGVSVHWYTGQPPTHPDASGNPAAMPSLDYQEVNTHRAQVIQFSPNQTTAKITIPIVDHHMPVPTKYFQVKIFGAGHVGSDNMATIEITGNETMPSVKNQADPLALKAPNNLGYPATGPTLPTDTTPQSNTTPQGDATAPTWLPQDQVATTHKFSDANPLAGVRFYDAPLQSLTTLFSQPAVNLFLAKSGNGKYKKTLAPISDVPNVMRFGTWDINAQGIDETAPDVANYLQNADRESPGTVPTLITYDLCHNSCRLPGQGHPTIVQEKGKCGQKTESTAQVNAFDSFINDMAEGISDHRVVVFLEEDSLITTKCLVHSSLANRIKELKYAVNVLGSLPRAAVYLDAGSDDAGISAAQFAKYLNEVGVNKIQGFFVNSTHSDWTLNEIKFGQAISRLTHGAHFVVDTEVNGRGPEVPMHKVGHGNEVNCNPTKVGLGPKPTTHTGYWHVDAFAWMGYPGLSDVPVGGCPDPDQPAVNGKPYVDPYANPKTYPTGVFIEPYAEQILKQANYKVAGTVSPRSVKLAH